MLFYQGKHAKCKQYVGHSAHVTNVRFSSDNNKLISTGGGDTSVLVWSHDGAPSLSALEEGENTDSEDEEEGTMYLQCIYYHFWSYFQV